MKSFQRRFIIRTLIQDLTRGFVLAMKNQIGTRLYLEVIIPNDATVSGWTESGYLDADLVEIK